MTTQPGFAIDAGVVSALIGKTILEAIGPEQRDALIAAAVDKMVRSTEHTEYGRKIVDPSPIQVAFEAAVREACGRIVREYIDSDEARPMVEKAIHDACRDLIADRESWYGKVADAVGSAISELVKEKS